MASKVFSHAVLTILNMPQHGQPASTRARFGFGSRFVMCGHHAAAAGIPATAEKIAASRKVAAEARLSKRKASRQDIFKRAEKYVKEYKTAEGDSIRMRREAKKAGEVV